MHGSNFSCLTGPNYDILMSFKFLLSLQVFRNVFGAVWFILYKYVVPKAFASMVIIIFVGEKQFARRSILFVAFCCGS